MFQIHKIVSHSSELCQLSQKYLEYSEIQNSEVCEEFRFKHEIMKQLMR